MKRNKSYSVNQFFWQPKDDHEAQSICERVTPRLSHANAAVVLSAVKVRIRANFTYCSCKLFKFLYLDFRELSKQSFSAAVTTVLSIAIGSDEVHGGNTS